MISNQDLYFFDTESYENIIDYYLDKNDPIKSLQVIEYATSQHPYAPVFMIKQAQLLLLTNQNGKALELLDQAESMEPSNPDIYMIRGGIYEQQEQHEKALENSPRELIFSDESAEVYIQSAFAIPNQGKNKEH